eukprot:3935874-Rhodomonas_salina.2
MTTQECSITARAHLDILCNLIGLRMSRTSKAEGVWGAAQQQARPRCWNGHNYERETAEQLTDLEKLNRLCLPAAPRPAKASSRSRVQRRQASALTPPSKPPTLSQNRPKHPPRRITAQHMLKPTDTPPHALECARSIVPHATQANEARDARPT